MVSTWVSYIRFCLPTTRSPGIYGIYMSLIYQVMSTLYSLHVLLEYMVSTWVSYIRLCLQSTRSPRIYGIYMSLIYQVLSTLYTFSWNIWYLHETNISGYVYPRHVLLEYMVSTRVSYIRLCLPSTRSPRIYGICMRLIYQVMSTLDTFSWNILFSTDLCIIENFTFAIVVV